MRLMRICIYGGTDLQGMHTGFISDLAYKILDSISAAVIVSGGFRYSDEDPTAVSVDVAALRGAQRFASERRIDLKDCYEACLPDPDLDSRLEDEGVVRMSEANGIAVQVMTGRTGAGGVSP